jgi:hypothetical protein
VIRISFSGRGTGLVDETDDMGQGVNALAQNEPVNEQESGPNGVSRRKCAFLKYLGMA